MDTPIVEPKEREVLPLSNISKEALKAIKEGLEDEKKGIFIPHDDVMKEAKKVIDQWEQKMMN
ncbi:MULTISPECIES: antitoxin [Capnocytophaga]|uniref:antitoxin n=1 Tax=Capnocytophaga TaxID=1016 RepID=UPI000D0431FD|nr:MULTISPECIES: antitoxin [Capnocytophaga]AVM55447.1 antitoxin [Capnocytophaga sp. oral taxon 864]UZD38795.1 antitoxin [Capnocytophaga ochracea]